MSSLAKKHKISYLCTLFEISRTACYRYKRGKSYNTDNKYNRSKHEIRIEFIRNFKRYGSRRVKASLEQEGTKIGRRKVAEIMRKEGLRAIQPRKFIPRTTAAADRYIDGYYNVRRLHSGLNYLNPIAFEALYYKKTG